MEDKYYTPSIEEFYVGFECEIETSWGYSSGEWPKILKLDSLTGFEKDIIKATKQASIRVKYLDKLDIEELGFKFSKADEKTHLLYYTKGRVVLAFMDVSTTEWIELYNAKSYDPNGPRIFKGCIKNKSELKKLLNQLGINA
jgi:hypothetical protein